MVMLENKKNLRDFNSTEFYAILRNSMEARKTLRKTRRPEDTPGDRKTLRETGRPEDTPEDRKTARKTLRETGRPEDTPGDRIRPSPFCQGIFAFPQTATGNYFLPFRSLLLLCCSAARDLTRAFTLSFFLFPLFHLSPFSFSIFLPVPSCPRPFRPR